jgi:hypothetical protein
MGACLTVLFVVITILFFYSKVMVMVLKSDVTVNSSLLEGKLTYDDKFAA